MAVSFLARAALVSTLAVSLGASQGASQPLKIYKLKTATGTPITYHLPDCPVVKERQADLVEIPIGELADGMATGHLTSCSVCHPFSLELAQAVSKYRDEKSAADVASRAEAARLGAEADRARAEASLAEEAAARKKAEVTPLTRLTEFKVRPMVQLAMAKAHNDVDAFDTELLAQILPIEPDYRGPVVLDIEGLSAVAVGPVARFHVAAREAVRKFEPLPAIVWTNQLEIKVEPLRIDSPDVEKIVLQRNGAVVVAASSTLAPKELTTGMGVKKAMHAGSVFFPLAAFAPGPDVVVDLIFVPVGGTNIVKTLRSIELRAFQ